MFNYYNPSSPIKTDSQFANFLYKSFGEGEYMLLAIQKGRKGFFSFFQLELRNTGFIRIRKKPSQEKKEIMSNEMAITQLKNTLGDAEDINEKDEILEEIEDLKEDNDLNKEIENAEQAKKRGPTPWLKQSQPVYHFHGYDSFSVEKSNVLGDQSLW